MLRRQCHSTSDECGTWADPQIGVYAGWVTRRRRRREPMPIRNETGDITLVFSGEEYPHPDTVRSLRKRGHCCEPDGASYLVHLLEEDPAFPAGLNGRFHGCAVDRRSETGLLFNDRYGLHRLYYRETKDALYFAAEAKAILDVCPETRVPEWRSVAELVNCGCVLENRTIFKGVGILPPGSAWVIERGKVIARKRYFDSADWENQERLDPEVFYERLRDVFAENLPRYFGGADRVAVSLTGGLDSRIVMAWQREPPGELPCYSFAGMRRDSEDVRLARQVATACEQPHDVIRLRPGFLREFARYAERTIYLTDGCVDVGNASDLYLNERAAEVAPVRMTGNYGSEVLRLVRAFKPDRATAGAWCRELSDEMGATTTTYASLSNVRPLTFILFRQAPWYHYGLLALEETQLKLRSPFLDNDFVRTLFQAPEGQGDNTVVSRRLIADGNKSLADVRTDRGLLGTQLGVLSSVQRAYLAFTFRAEYAFDAGMPQWLAACDRLVPFFRPENVFLGRHKFTHFRTWYRDELSDYVREMLLDDRALSRSHVDRARLATLVENHVSGRANHTAAIHKLITLELIHRLFFDPWTARSF
jgi:asparagine synthase (glutamine-hydrolysing)